MKINLRSFEATDHMLGNRMVHISFYIMEKKTKLNPLDYQVYKLHTNQKDEKYAMYLLTVGIYEAGILEEWLQFLDTIKQVIKG
eukprot:9611238-Ditylum_brightwellii.AAC.1